jgi:hypothetical protein
LLKRRVRKMSSVAERREMKPRTDCMGVSQYALEEEKRSRNGCDRRADLWLRDAEERE